jgi:hypothetical protein
MAITLTASPNASYTFPSQGCCLKYEWDDPDAVVSGTLAIGAIHFIWADIQDGDYFTVDGQKFTYKNTVSDPSSEIEIDTGGSFLGQNTLINTMTVLQAQLNNFRPLFNANRILLYANNIGTRWNNSIDISNMYDVWDFSSSTLLLEGTDTRLQTDYRVDIDINLGGCFLGSFQVFPKLILDNCSLADELSQNYTLVIEYDIANIIETSKNIYVNYLEDQVTPNPIRQENYIGLVSLTYKSYYVDYTGTKIYSNTYSAPDFNVGYGLCSESGQYLDVADQIIDGNTVTAKWLTRSNEIILCGNTRPKACIYLPDVPDYGIEVDGFTAGCTDDPASIVFGDPSCRAFNGIPHWIAFIPNFITNIDLTQVSGTITIKDGGIETYSSAISWVQKVQSGNGWQYDMPSIQSFGGLSGEETIDYVITATSSCAIYEIRFGYYIQIGGPGEPNCSSLSSSYITITDVTPAGNFWSPAVSTDLTEGLHCIDFTLLANSIGIGSSASFRLYKNISTAPVAVSESLVISRSSDTHCCCTETFYFLSDIGSYLPITLTCDQTYNIELSGPSYVPCSDCNPLDQNYAHLTGPATERLHYNTTYLVKNKYSSFPVSATEDNITIFQDFLSSNHIINSKGEVVHIKRNERSIKKESGQIRLSLTMYKAVRQRSLNRY